MDETKALLYQLAVFGEVETYFDTLETLGKALQKYMNEKAVKFISQGCDGCRHCCYGYETSRAWCSTGDRHLRTAVDYWRDKVF